MTSSHLSLFVSGARRHGSRVALDGDERRVDHAGRVDEVARLAAGLRAMGLAPGDRLALLAANGVEAMLLLDAAAWLGLIAVPVNTRLSAGEIEAILSDCDPAVIAAEPAWAEVGGRHTERIAMGGHDPRRETPASLARHAAIGPAAVGDEAPVLLVYTAATEGRAKGAVLTHGNLAASARQLARAWSLGPEDAALGVLPLCHVAGLALHAALLSVGGAVLPMPKFDPAVAAQRIHERRVSVTGTFSPMLAQVLDAAEAAALDLGHWRIAFGLESLQTIERLQAAAPQASWWCAYGQAETGGPVAGAPWREASGAVGRALRGTELRIVDDLGATLPHGRAGRIAVRGPTVSPGYWRHDVPASPLRAEGWHDTGDLGALDDDGYLWFRGPAPDKRLIKTGGENVYPAEVEQALRSHPAVHDAMVVGLPDAKWGEVVAALCTLRGPFNPGTAPAASPEALPDTLIEFVGTVIARYKRPKRIALVNCLPLDAQGRPDLERAREILAKAAL